MVCRRRCKRKKNKQTPLKTREISHDIFKYAYGEHPYGCGNCLKTFRSKDQIVAHYLMCCQQNKKLCHNQAWSDDLLEAMFDGRCIDMHECSSPLSYCALDKIISWAQKFRMERSAEHLWIKDIIAKVLGTIMQYHNRHMEKPQLQSINRRLVLKSPLPQVFSLKRSISIAASKQKCCSKANCIYVNSLQKRAYRVESAECCKDETPSKQSRRQRTALPDGGTDDSVGGSVEAMIMDKTVNKECVYRDASSWQMEDFCKIHKAGEVNCILAGSLGTEGLRTGKQPVEGMTGLRKEQEDLISHGFVMGNKTSQTETHSMQHCKERCLTTDQGKIKENTKCRIAKWLANRVRKSNEKAGVNKDSLSLRLIDETWADETACDDKHFNCMQDIVYCLLAKAADGKFRPCKKLVRDQLHQFLQARLLGNSSPSLQGVLSCSRTNVKDWQQTEDLNAQTYLQEQVFECIKNYENDVGNLNAAEGIKKHEMDVGNSSCLKTRKKSQNTEGSVVEHLDDKTFTKGILTSSKRIADVLINSIKSNDDSCCLDTENDGHHYRPCKKLVRDHLCQFLMARHLGDNIQHRHNAVKDKSNNTHQKENHIGEHLMVQDTRTHFLNGMVTDDLKKVSKSGGKLGCLKLKNKTRCSEVLVVEHLDNETFRERIALDLGNSEHSVVISESGAETVDDQFRPCKKLVRDQLYQLLISRKLGDSFQYMQDVLAGNASLQAENSNQEREYLKVADLSSQNTEIGVADLANSEKPVRISCLVELQNQTEKLEQLDKLNTIKKNHFYMTVDDCKKNAGEFCFLQPDKRTQEGKCLPILDFSSDIYESDQQEHSEKSIQDSESTSGEFCSVKLEKRTPSMEFLPIRDRISESDIKKEEEVVDTDQSNSEHFFSQCLENPICKTEKMVEHCDAKPLEEREKNARHFPDRSADEFCGLMAEAVDDQFRPCKKPVRDQLYQFLMARRLGDQSHYALDERRNQTYMQMEEDGSQELMCFQSEDLITETSINQSLAGFSSCANNFNTCDSLEINKEIHKMNCSQFKYSDYENYKTEENPNDHENSRKDVSDTDFIFRGTITREIQCLAAADLNNETEAKEMVMEDFVTMDKSTDDICNSVADSLDNQTGPCTHAVRDQLRHLLMARFANKTSSHIESENFGYAQEKWLPNILKRNNIKQSIMHCE